MKLLDEIELTISRTCNAQSENYSFRTVKAKKLKGYIVAISRRDLFMDQYIHSKNVMNKVYIFIFAVVIPGSGVFAVCYEADAEMEHTSSGNTKAISIFS